MDKLTETMNHLNDQVKRMEQANKTAAEYAKQMCQQAEEIKKKMEQANKTAAEYAKQMYQQAEETKKETQKLAEEINGTVNKVTPLLEFTKELDILKKFREFLQQPGQQQPGPQQ